MKTHTGMLSFPSTRVHILWVCAEGIVADDLLVHHLGFLFYLYTSSMAILDFNFFLFIIKYCFSEICLYMRYFFVFECVYVSFKFYCLAHEKVACLFFQPYFSPLSLLKCSFFHLFLICLNVFQWA